MAFLKKAAFSAFAMSFLAATPVLAADWTIDPAHPEEGHAKITIDVASATTADKQRDGPCREVTGSMWPASQLRHLKPTASGLKAAMRTKLLER